MRTVKAGGKDGAVAAEDDAADSRVIGNGAEACQALFPESVIRISTDQTHTKRILRSVHGVTLGGAVQLDVKNALGGASELKRLIGGVRHGDDGDDGDGEDVNNDDTARESRDVDDHVDW